MTSAATIEAAAQRVRVARAAEAAAARAHAIAADETRAALDALQRARYLAARRGE